jgi:hypothetical protein
LLISIQQYQKCKGAAKVPQSHTTARTEKFGVRRTVARRAHQRFEDSLAGDVLHPDLAELLLDEIERCIALGEDVGNSLW